MCASQVISSGVAERAAWSEAGTETVYTECPMSPRSRENFICQNTEKCKERKAVANRIVIFFSLKTSRYGATLFTLSIVKC
jgi:hypothetical protein